MFVLLEFQRRTWFCRFCLWDYCHFFNCAEMQLTYNKGPHLNCAGWGVSPCVELCEAIRTPGHARPAAAPEHACPPRPAPHVRQQPRFSSSGTPASHFPFFMFLVFSHHIVFSNPIFLPFLWVRTIFHYSVVNFFLPSPHFGVGCTQRVLYLDSWRF